MRNIFNILILIFGLSLDIFAQAGDYINRKVYIEKFNEAKRLISKNKYLLAKEILFELISQKDIDVVGCEIKSEIYNQSGFVLYFLNKRIKAFDIWKNKTLPIRLRCDSLDQIMLAQTYYNIAYSYSQFCDYKNVIENVNYALDIIDSLELRHSFKKYTTWCKLAYFSYRNTGDYNSAEGYIFKAILNLDSFEINSVREAKLYIDLVNNFIDKKDYKLAKFYFDKAKLISVKKNSDLSSLINHKMSSLYWHQCDFNESIKWSNKALYFYNKNKVKDKKELAKIYNTLGLALSYNNEFDKALSNFFKSLKLKEESNAKNTELSVAYENISGTYGRKGDLYSALYYIDLSIEKLHNFGDKNLPKDYVYLRKNDFNKLSMVRKLQMKGKFLSRMGKSKEDVHYLIDAEDQFGKADSLVLLVRKDIRDKESKVLLGTSLDTIYKYAIDNSFALWDATKDKKYLEIAYKYIGENKAVVFSETKEELNAVWEILDSNLRVEYLEISDELKSNMYQKQYAVLKDDSISYKRLNNEFLELSIEKEKLFEKIKIEYPDFYQQIYGELNPKSISDLQDKLDDDNAILEYYIDGSKLYTYIISKSDFTAVKQETELNIDSLFNIYGEELTSFSNSKSIKELSKKVYPLLFPEKVNRFLSKNNIDRLIVIRDKNLNKITFGSIMTGDNLNNDFLIFDYAFSYAFNSKYIWDRSVIEKKKELDFGGFATNHDTETLEEITKDIIFWIGSFPPVLKPLEQSIDEVNTISEIFDSKIWIGNDANYSNFVENANKSKILHLSLHSLIASGNNEQNGLIFQKTENNKEFILKSSDLIGLRLDNSLSVLSSCYSSDGKVITGEGINSLARSFALAGSPAIVASQWQAYEGQTRDILTSFYSYLKDGYSKGISLQKAKQDFISNAKGEFTSPANWANLVLLGDPKVIDLGDTLIEKLVFVFFFILIVLLSVFLFKKYKSRRSSS